MSKLKVKVSGKKLTITCKKAKNAKKYTVSIRDKANRAGDTLYVLQGRNEVGLRGFNPERATTIYKRYADGDKKNYAFGSEYGRGNKFGGIDFSGYPSQN